MFFRSSNEDKNKVRRSAKTVCWISNKTADYVKGKLQNEGMDRISRCNFWLRRVC